jgi:hypothetical protein
MTRESVLDQHSSDTGGLQSPTEPDTREFNVGNEGKRCSLRDETTDHSREGDTGDDFGLGWSHGAEDTNLDTDGSQVGKAAKGVLGNDPSAVRERVIAAHDRLQAQVGGKLVGDQLGSEETSDAEDLWAGDTEEECDGVENVSEDQLERKVIDGETLSNPGEQTVNGGNEG